MPQSNKYSQKRAQIVIDHLSMGATKRTAADMALVSDRSVRNWIDGGDHYPFEKTDPVTGETLTITFAEAVEQAESAYEVACQAQLAKQMSGVDTKTVVVKNETVIGKRTIRHPDGTVVTEDYPIVKETTITTTGKEVDFDSPKFWLSRRRKKDYGATIAVDFESEINATVGAILAAAAGMGRMAGETTAAVAGEVARGIAATFPATDREHQYDGGEHDCDRS